MKILSVLKAMTANQLVATGVGVAVTVTGTSVGVSKIKKVNAEIANSESEVVDTVNGITTSDEKVKEIVSEEDTYVADSDEAEVEVEVEDGSKVNNEEVHVKDSKPNVIKKSNNSGSSKDIISSSNSGNSNSNSSNINNSNPNNSVSKPKDDVSNSKDEISKPEKGDSNTNNGNSNSNNSSSEKEDEKWWVGLSDAEIEKKVLSGLKWRNEITGETYIGRDGVTFGWYDEYGGLGGLILEENKYNAKIQKFEGGRDSVYSFSNATCYWDAPDYSRQVVFDKIVIKRPKQIPFEDVDKLYNL